MDNQMKIKLERLSATKKKEMQDICFLFLI